MNQIKAETMNERNEGSKNFITRRNDCPLRALTSTTSVRPKQFRYRFSAEISVSAEISAWPKWKNHFGIGFGFGRNKEMVSVSVI